MPNIKDLFEVYRPKPKDEQEFVDKHVVVKHKDENGNGDDVFNASNVKKVDRKKTRMGYAVPEDEKVYESMHGSSATMGMRVGAITQRKREKEKVTKNKTRMDYDTPKDQKVYEEADIDEGRMVGIDYKPTSEKSKFGPGHRAKLLNPEGRLSYLSQKAYKTAKHAKDAAKFYHSIGNLPTQTIDNKMSQYNKAYDAKHKMNEAVELDKDQIANSILEMAEVEGVDLTEQELNNLVNTLIEGADEDTQEKSEMAQTQLHFIKYAVKEILEYITMGGEIEEWYQNKLSKVHSDVESLHSYVEGEKRRTGMVKEDAHIHPKLQELIDRHPEVDRALNTGLNFQHAHDAMDHVAGHVLHKMDYNDWNQYRQPLIDHFKSYGLKEDTDEQIDEVLKASTPMKTWIKDFTKSDAPQFKGKSAEKRREMAIAAKLEAERGSQNEEVEQIDELSKKTLKSYIDKNNTRVKDYPTPLSFRKAMLSPGIAKAKLGKSYKRRPLPDVKIKATNEEIELDEVFDTPKGKAVGRAYINRASTNAFGKGFTGGAMLNRQIDDPASREQEQKGGEKAVKTGLKRLVGIGRAIDRLTKEEVDQIDELSKEAIASYTVQAADDLPVQARKTGASKVKNRIKGINMAVDRLTKEDIINNAINKFVPEEAKYTVDERFAMRLEDVPELHRPALAELFNGLTEANKKVMLNQLSEEAGLQKLINFVIENRND